MYLNPPLDQGIVVVGLYNKQIVCTWLVTVAGIVCVKKYASYCVPFEGSCFIANTLVCIVTQFLAQHTIIHPLLAFVVSSEFMILQSCITFSTATPSDQQIKDTTPSSSFWAVEYAYPTQEEHAFYLYAMSYHIMHLCRITAAKLKIPLCAILPEWSALLYSYKGLYFPLCPTHSFFKAINSDDQEIIKLFAAGFNSRIQVAHDCLVEKNRQLLALCGAGMMERYETNKYT